MKIWHWPCWPAVRQARRPLASSSRAPRCRSSSCSLSSSSWSFSSSSSNKQHQQRRRLRLSSMRRQRLGRPNRWPIRRPTGGLVGLEPRTALAPPPRPSRKRRRPRRKVTSDPLLVSWAVARTGQRPPQPQSPALRMLPLLRWPPPVLQPRTLAQ